MVYQHYCTNCGSAVSLKDKICPICNEKILHNSISDNTLIELPIHNIGFFNFDIDFSPYIKNSRKNYNYYLCSCGFINDIDKEYCLYCGEKHTKSKFNRLINRFTKEKPLKRTITCECGEINDADNAFCEYCGKNLKLEKENNDSENDKKYENFNLIYDSSVFCYCGCENDSHSDFCINCGFPIYMLENKPKSLSVLCTCKTLNHITDVFCRKCGIPLNVENEVLICSCGAHNHKNDKFCKECERPLNPIRNIKTKLVCSCGAILDYSAEYCVNCGKYIPKAIDRAKRKHNAKNKLKGFKEKLL